MIGVALLSVVRRWHFREGVPIRALSRLAGDFTRKQTAIARKGLSGTIELVNPKPQAGFTIANLGDALRIFALFAGRLPIGSAIISHQFE